MGVQTQGGRDGQNGPPIISVFFSEETMKEGLGVAVGVLTLLSRSEARAKAAGRRHVTHLFPFPCRHAATHPRCCSGTLYISDRPPSTPKTSIGSITRLADPAIPSLLQEGLPTRRDSRTHLRSRSAARFRPHAVQTILHLFRFTSYSSRS